jgi:glucose/arabinose dehydrogenase
MLFFAFELLSVYRVIIVYLALLVSSLVPLGHNNIITYAQEEIEDVNTSIGGEEQPSIKDSNLKVELVSSEGLELPTSMAFLGQDDILVLEKDKGTVQRIVDGRMLPEPLLDVNVANKSERGLLGIAVSKNQAPGTNHHPIYVFLYYTESQLEGSDICPIKGEPCLGGVPLGNRLYRYELANNKLINPKLLLDLPVTPGPSHNGGVVKIGPDNNVYLVVGDLNYIKNQSAYTIAQNAVGGRFPDGRGGILRITQNGEVVGGGDDGEGILGNEDPLNKYYAYGIRNSFGIAFDPVTQKLWDTENGGSADEINLVEPGFNSGWKQLMGMASLQEEFDPDKDLVDFGGRGKYSDPEFQWTSGGGGGDDDSEPMRINPAPTAIAFLNSDKLGEQYENDMFVGSVKEGRIFNFDLNDNRTELVLGNLLDDKVADTADELEDITFADGLGLVTDLEVGPDGYLYVVSIGHGAIYRILPAVDVVATATDVEGIEEEEEEEDSD